MSVLTVAEFRKPTQSIYDSSVLFATFSQVTTSVTCDIVRMYLQSDH